MSEQRLDSLAQYLREIGRHRLLTRAEEVALAKRIEAGDKTAKSRMVESNLRLVVAVARTRNHHGVPLLDLIQEGTLGLIRAVERFDWRRGTKLSTYAAWWIRQAVDRAVLDQAEPIRVPAHVHERRRRLSRAEHGIEARPTGKPTLEELAVAAGISLEQAQQALASRHVFTPLDPTDADLSCLADPQAGDDYQQVGVELTISPLQELLSRLLPEQRRVIELRYGIHGDECSVDQAAEALDIPPSTVTTLEREALRRLRELASPAELRLAA